MWSKKHLGNIFDNTKALEEKVVDLEEMSIAYNSDTNRAELNKANVELIIALKKKEDYWNKKSGIRWLIECEVNSKFFHFVVNGKRRRLSQKKIKKEDGS